METIGEEFNKEFGTDPRKNLRCKLRMFEAIEKARKIISSTADSVIGIDSLLDDEDLTRRLSREEFETICDPILRKFVDLLNATVEMSGINVDDIHSVEMVGDATRTPIVLNLTS